MLLLKPVVTRLLSLTVSIVGVASVSACASPAPAPSETPAEYSKLASADLRDIEFCLTNNSGTSVTVTWPETPLNSTHDGEGTLDAGEKICGEGPGAIAQVNFQDGFANYVWGFNTYFTKPSVKFQTVDSDPNPRIFAEDYYKIGQSITSDVEGHSYTVTRLEDDDWINFAVTINK